MPGKLNPDHMRFIMDKDELRGLEATYLTRGKFGISNETGKETDEDWKLNYRGWSVPGKMYCVLCWEPIAGIPRDIIQLNSCPGCQEQLYPAHDEGWLDYRGFEIYCDRVEAYSVVAIKNFRELIDGSEHVRAWGSVDDGYRSVHRYSIREAFENRVAESVVASPANIQVVPTSSGLPRRLSPEELRTQHAAFLETNSNWQTLVEQSDQSEMTLIWDEDDKEL